MKFRKTIAASAGVTVVAASVLMGAGAAQAADFYIEAADFGVEGASYADSWFIGGGSTGVHTSGVSGLTLTGAATTYQILNGDTPTTGLVSLVDGASIDVTAGTAFFQVPVFFADDNDLDANVEFTTLRTTVSSAVDVTSGAAWTTSRDIIDPAGNVLYAAQSTATLAQFQTALGAGYEVLAFGALVNAGTSATIASIVWDGDVHWFLPVPTATLTPASATVTQTSTSGITATLTGFVPGETVGTGVGYGQSGDDLGDVIADANGAVTFTFVSSTRLAPGTQYSLGAFALESGVAAFADFTVTADPAAAAALPNTGSDATATLIGAGSLLVAGLGFAVVAMRRRAAANN